MTACATSDGVFTPSSAPTPPARFFGPCMQQESSGTMPSAFGKPPEPTLSSSGSSSTMLTPAMTASRTSAPSVIIVKALCTAVIGPPFLNLLPFADEITKGLTEPCLRIIGKPVTSFWVVAIARPATALLRMKSRRFIFLLMVLLLREIFLISSTELCSLYLEVFSLYSSELSDEL